VPPPLVTERLVLRALQPQDGAALWQEWNDPLVWRYVGAGVLPERGRIERGAALLGRMDLERGWSGLLVRGAATGGCWGSAGSTRGGRRAWRPVRWSWGTGSGGSTGVRATPGRPPGRCWTGRAGELGFTELVCVVQEANTASRRIAERLGFRLQDTRHHDVGGVLVHDCWYQWTASADHGPRPGPGAPALADDVASR